MCLLTATLSLGHFSASAHAQSSYAPSYSAVAQARLEAAREQRKEAARKRIDEILHGTSEAPSKTTAPKALMSRPQAVPPPSPQPAYYAPPPPAPAYYAPPPPAPAYYAPPPPAPPVTPPYAYTPPPQLTEQPLAVYTPSISPTTPELIPHQTDIVLPKPAPGNSAKAPASSSAEALPWKDMAATPETSPKTVEKAEDVPPSSPASSPREGVVADKSYILAPGAPPPPAPSPPLKSYVGTPPEASPATREVMLPEVAAALAANARGQEEETLSPETEQILDALPVDIIGAKPVKATPREFSVERADPSTTLPELTTVPEASEGGTAAPGMKVALKQRPIDVDYELEKAYLALTAGNTEEAIAVYKSVLEIAPENTSALFGLATTYHRVGLLDKARPVYGKLLKLDPRNKDAINNFLVLVGEEAPERALEHMKHLEADNPEFAPIPAQMALLYSKIGDTESAIKSMQRAVNTAPENLVYKYNLAILYDKAQKPVEASILYKQLLEARFRGEKIPADADEIQQRLTFLLSNKG